MVLSRAMNIPDESHRGEFRIFASANLSSSIVLVSIELKDFFSCRGIYFVFRQG